MTDRQMGNGDPRFPYRDFGQQQTSASFADGIVPGLSAQASPMQQNNAEVPTGPAPAVGMAESLPQPLQPQAGVPQKAASKRKWWVVSVLALVGLLAVFGVWSLLNRGPESPAGTSPVSSPSREVLPNPLAPRSFQPGEYQLETNTWLWEITEVDMNASGRMTASGSSGELAAGEKAIMVLVKVTNRSPMAADPFYDFTYLLLDPNDSNHLFFERNLLSAPDMMISVGEVPPGESAEAWIAFIVPENLTAAILTVTDWESGSLTETEFAIP